LIEPDQDRGSAREREGPIAASVKIVQGWTEMRIDAAGSAFPEFGEHEGLSPLVS
jgi:hypothetical protein